MPPYGSPPVGSDPLIAPQFSHIFRRHVGMPPYGSPGSPPVGSDPLIAPSSFPFPGGMWACLPTGPLP